LKHEIVKFKEAPMFKQSAECSRLQGKWKLLKIKAPLRIQSKE
jgi:hypothetical protein